MASGTLLHHNRMCGGRERKVRLKNNNIERLNRIAIISVNVSYLQIFDLSLKGAIYIGGDCSG